MEEPGLHTTERRSTRVALSILFSLALTGAVRAETPAGIAQRWGLIGAWSLDCSLPPDRDRGTVLVWETGADGRLAHRRRFGDVSDEAEVTDAAVSRDGMLSLRVVFAMPKQTREVGLRMLADGSIRTIFSRNEKGEYTVSDGKFTRDNRPTPPLHKCE
jgi:hypothetical protein